MTNQERQEFNDWREDNCIGFRTQCTQYRFDFKSIQGLEDYYIKEYMSDVIEFNGIRFDSISAMEDYMESYSYFDYIDIVAENMSQGKYTMKETYDMGIKIGRRLEQLDILQKEWESEGFFDDDEDYETEGLLDGED
jgi:hypothetical protein